MSISNTQNSNKLKVDSISYENDGSNIQNFLESSIKISEIENKENPKSKKLNLYEDNNNIEISMNSYINLDVQNINQINKEKEINKVNTIKKKLTKEDLNNIPLPIFSCIYCSNDYISFRHLSNEQLSSKYYIQTSIYDIKILNKLIQNQPLNDQYSHNFKLLDIIIKNTDYLKKYYSKKNSLIFYKTEQFKSFCFSNNLRIKKFFMHRLENFIIRKKNKDFTNKKTNANKFTNKNISYNKLSFHNNNSNSIVNDNYNNLLGYIKNSNNTFGTGTCQGTGSYSSMNNIVSFSLNNNDNNNILCFNNNMMENIMERIEKNEESENDEEGGEEFLNIFGNESQFRNRINKNNISFEEHYYDIWKPNIITITDEDKNNKKDNEESYIYKNNINNKIKNKNDGVTNDLNNNKFKLNINKIEKGENLKRIFSDKRINEIKKLLNYSHTSYLQNKNSNLLKNSKINIKKKGRINLVLIQIIIMKIQTKILLIFKNQMII